MQEEFLALVAEERDRGAARTTWSTSKRRTPRSRRSASATTRRRGRDDPLAAVLLVTGVLTGSGLPAGQATAGFANVWPLALLFAGLGIVAAGFGAWLFERRDLAA